MTFPAGLATRTKLGLNLATCAREQVLASRTKLGLDLATCAREQVLATPTKPGLYLATCIPNLVLATGTKLRLNLATCVRKLVLATRTKLGLNLASCVCKRSGRASTFGHCRDSINHVRLSRADHASMYCMAARYLVAEWNSCYSKQVLHGSNAFCRGTKQLLQLV